jgi:hypothetical protein
MAETITLELPEKITLSARQLASHTQQRVEDILLGWLNQGASEVPVEMLSDARVLALAEAELAAEKQIELSELLYQNSEGTLNAKGRARLDELMQMYRTGLVRKAEAMQVAVKRGLRPPLN